MRISKWTSLFLIVFGGLIVSLVRPTAASADSRPIVVGSKSFSESKTVSEIYALALEHAGYRVKRMPNISNSVVYSAVRSGQVDVYPEYTGTIVETYLKQNGSGKNAPQMAKIAQRGMQKVGLTTFDYAPGDNRQGIGIRTKVAKKYGIKDLSDLQRQAHHIRFVSQGEFDQRSDGLPGMNKKYGQFNFKSKKDYADSLKYKIMLEGKGDAAPVSTTDGQLATKHFQLVRDSSQLWPPYNLVPLVNAKAAHRYPKMRAVLNRVDAKLTTAQLIALNKQVDVKGQNYQTVARNWYNHHLR